MFEVFDVRLFRTFLLHFSHFYIYCITLIYLYNLLIKLWCVQYITDAVSAELIQESVNSFMTKNNQNT